MQETLTAWRIPVRWDTGKIVKRVLACRHPESGELLETGGAKRLTLRNGVYVRPNGDPAVPCSQRQKAILPQYQRFVLARRDMIEVTDEDFGKIIQREPNLTTGYYYPLAKEVCRIALIDHQRTEKYRDGYYSVSTIDAANSVDYLRWLSEHSEIISESRETIREIDDQIVMRVDSLAGDFDDVPMSIGNLHHVISMMRHLSDMANMRRREMSLRDSKLSKLGSASAYNVLPRIPKESFLKKVFS